jgi:hypothetical protein
LDPQKPVTIIFNSLAILMVLSDCRDILSAVGLNTVTFSDPYAKLCFTSMVARAYTPATIGERTHKRVIYIDTDTFFTAYLMAGFIILDKSNASDSKKVTMAESSKIGSPLENTSIGCERVNDNIQHKTSFMSKRLIDVYLPSQGRFEALLGQVIASMPEASIVIFDSLNSFYNMYPIVYTESGLTRQPLRKEREELEAAYKSLKTTRARQRSKKGLEYGKPKESGYAISRLNHLLSIFIMLLVKHGVYLKIPVLVTGMVRYKKVSEDLWIKSAPCRRFLHQKSVVRLSLDMGNEKELLVNIMKHPSIVQQTVLFPDAGVFSTFEVDQGKPEH